MKLCSCEQFQWRNKLITVLWFEIKRSWFLKRVLVESTVSSSTGNFIDNLLCRAILSDDLGLNEQHFNGVSGKAQKCGGTCSHSLARNYSRCNGARKLTQLQITRGNVLEKLPNRSEPTPTTSGSIEDESTQKKWIDAAVRYVTDRTRTSFNYLGRLTLTQRGRQSWGAWTRRHAGGRP